VLRCKSGERQARDLLADICKGGGDGYVGEWDLWGRKGGWWRDQIITVRKAEGSSVDFGEKGGLNLT
jgi:hypothetical protein